MRVGQHGVAGLCGQGVSAGITEAWSEPMIENLLRLATPHRQRGCSDAPRIGSESTLIARSKEDRQAAS
jgi:hypothetical protein